MFKKLFIRVCLCVLGVVCDIDLLLWLCKFVIGLYLWYFVCNVIEVVEEEIVNYLSFGVFFKR